MKDRFKYTSINDRQVVTQYLKQNSFVRVLDIGYSANTWSSEFITHYVDIFKIESPKICFEGDINMPFVWEEILKDVEINGKFDFCICTHVFEDIINPFYVSLMIEKIAKMGFVAVPSKYQEFSKFEGPYKGYIHHRYVFNKEDKEFVAYPKLNFLETDARFDEVSNKLTNQNTELQFFWKETIGLNIINNNFMGPSVNHVYNLYQHLLKD